APSAPASRKRSATVVQVTICPGETFVPLLLSARAIKVISEVESQFCSSSNFSLPRSVPAGNIRISSISRRNSARVIEIQSVAVYCGSSKYGLCMCLWFGVRCSKLYHYWHSGWKCPARGNSRLAGVHSCSYPPLLHPKASSLLHEVGATLRSRKSAHYPFRPSC